MESALVPIRGGWRRLRHSASFVSLSSLSKAGRESTGEVTPLDWWAVLGIQSLSMISILSSTMVFSTAVFMVREWGAVDEAKAAAHAGLMIAAKPGFSALSSYAWGRRGDTLGFRTTMLFSALVTAVLTAALGAVSSFHWALALRALTGFCDGVMTLTKSAMAKISDRTNSAKAFSTFGVTYGLGSSVGPTIAALLAYPCGGDPNADKEGSPLFSSGCPAHVLRKYPFLLSTAWVGALGLALWTFAFLKMKIPGDGNIPGAAPNARRPEGGDARTPSRAPIGDREVEMASVAEIRGFETEDGAKVRISGRGVLAEDAERGDCLQTVAVTVAESDDSDGEGEDAALLRRPSRDEGTPRSRDSPASVASDAREVNATNETNKKDTWHTDHAVRLATHAQVWCAFIVITGAELTPIWMATSVANGGLGFSAVDIGAFGGVMGIIILVFAATLFSNLANAFGVTTAVRWALTANGIIYLSHPLAWYAERAGNGALTWTLVVAFALGRGCMGPIVMGGVSLILNNSAPRKHLGAVNGFAGAFTNVARAAAPVFAGALTAGMVHAARTLTGDGAGEGDRRKNGFEYDVAEAVPPTWWPFALLSTCFFLLSRMAAKMPRSLDAPRAEEEG
jgi:hypothetical protein